MPIFPYLGNNQGKDIDEQKKSIYVWVIMENKRLVDIIYVGLIDKTNLQERNKLHQTGFKGKGNGGSNIGGKLRTGILNRNDDRKIVVYLR